MACETNILDIPLLTALLEDDDVLLITRPNGETYTTYLGTLKAAITSARGLGFNGSNGVFASIAGAAFVKRAVYLGNDVQTIAIGTTPGDDDIFSGTVNQYDTVPIDQFFPNPGATLYISGLTGARAFQIYVE